MEKKKNDSHCIFCGRAKFVPMYIYMVESAFSYLHYLYICAQYALNGKSKAKKDRLSS